MPTFGSDLGGGDPDRFPLQPQRPLRSSSANSAIKCFELDWVTSRADIAEYAENIREGRRKPGKCGAGALAREKPGISAGVFAHRVLVQSFPRSQLLQLELAIDQPSSYLQDSAANTIRIASHSPEHRIK
jgi:hypothetical protein